MKYIINPQYLLRGWYKSPTGLFDMRKGKTRFFLKEQYLLLLRCNGVDDIDESSLTDANVKFLEGLKKNDVIREALFLDYLLPEQEYRVGGSGLPKQLPWLMPPLDL